MKRWIAACLLGPVLGLAAPVHAAAQTRATRPGLPASARTTGNPPSTELPGVLVHASAWQRHFGGFIISSSFTVNPKLPYMVYPSSALKHRDILKIQPVNLQDDEYLVLQVCVTRSCDEARIVRLWDTNGVMAQTRHDSSQVTIPHMARYFIWLKRLPEVMFAACAGCNSHFTSFHLISPPLTLIPDGQLTAYYKDELEKASREPPVKVASGKHEGPTYVVTFASGSKVRIQRLRPEHPR